MGVPFLGPKSTALGARARAGRTEQNLDGVHAANDPRSTGVTHKTFDFKYFKFVT